MGTSVAREGSLDCTLAHCVPKKHLEPRKDLDTNSHRNKNIPSMMTEHLLCATGSTTELAGNDADKLNPTFTELVDNTQNKQGTWR